MRCGTVAREEQPRGCLERRTATMPNDLVRGVYEVWNQRDPEAVAGFFGAGATYVDPLTRADVRGEAIVAHVRRFVGSIRDLRFSAIRTVADASGAAVSWTLDGTCDGELNDELKAQGFGLRMDGVDLFDFAEGGTSRGCVERSIGAHSRTRSGYRPSLSPSRTAR